MVEQRPGSFRLELFDALNISMAKADEALDAGDREAHALWNEWSSTLLAELQRLQQQQ